MGEPRMGCASWPAQPASFISSSSLSKRWTPSSRATARRYGRSRPSRKPFEDDVFASVQSSVKRHFPRGAPMLGDVRWMSRARTRLWGFFRYQDKHLALSPLLSSPDVPRFAVEFVMFHELLHADMPSAGHNPDFRERERRFMASPLAIEEAKALGIVPTPGSPPDYWRVRAEMFLDTFERYFAWREPGTAMEF